jgi:hypothetical protein
MSEAERFFGQRSPVRSSNALVRIGAAISFAAPCVALLVRAGTTSSWRDDLVLLRGLAHVGMGATGNVSAVLAQGAFFLPLGSVHFRLALAAALVLGAAGLATFALTRELLDRRRETAPLLVDSLATIAALAATLSIAAQREGSTLGGGGVALVLSLLVLRARPTEALGDAARAVPLGMLAGALFAESPITALSVALAIALARPFEEPRRHTRALPWVLGAAFVTAGVLLLPSVLRPLAPSSFLEFGRAISALHAPPRALGESLSARLAAEGAVVVVFALGGIAHGLVARSLRAGVVPLAALIACDTCAELAQRKWLDPADVAPLHWLGSAVLAIGTAIAVQSIAVALLAWRLPMAKGAAILLVMSDLTVAVAAAEEASFASDRSAWRGAEALTDEIWDGLPPNAVLLLRSQAAARRVGAALLAQGTRTDVLVVPALATRDARIALRLLQREPALQKVVQDIALEGRPGEEALTILADARPVFAEFDPSWDRRVYSHLVPENGWLRFWPEPRGASDRRAAFADLRTRSDRVIAASIAGGKPDPDTGAMLRARLMDGAVIAALLGDREEATALAARVGEIQGGELFSAELMQKILATKSGPIDAKGLLR